ncbi:MAG TPA: type VI secretion system baseplate subunit TssE [Methylomirabilota bacterium]|nr:type VI secretion system baseplate subunit TssE [Methylomirabilota bacterium]
MPELTPSERLQPCLLDRLTDDEPGNKEESRNQRVISLQKYKRGVLRDLEWLFNASAHLPVEGKKQFRLQDYPEAHRSVLNFGTRHLCGLIAPDMEELEREMNAALQLFEPRILRHTLAIKATIERNVIGFELHAELWANPMSEKLFIKTNIDLETGQCLLGDGGNG